METHLGWEIRFLFLAAGLTVGVCGDTCKVTHHQGKAVTYNILNSTSNAKCEYNKCDYNWAHSYGTVLATEREPKGKGIISSSHRSLTLPECLKNVCVTIHGPPKYYNHICCLTDCTAAPEPPANFPAAQEPQEHIDPTTSSPPPLAVFWTPEVTGVIKGGIVVVIAMVIAAVCCRKKISSWLERFKGACSSKNHKAEVEKMEDQRLYRC